MLDYQSMPREPLPPPTNLFIPPTPPEILVHSSPPAPPDIKLPPEVPPVAKPKAIKVRIKKVAPATKSKKETEATVLAKGIITEEIKSNECEYSITTTIHEYGGMLIKSPYSCP
jgi:hypothetical protein